MQYNNNVVTGLKIAYIGGGSRGWAWGLMSDLASCDDINGDVYLYDIDMEAAKNNEVIGTVWPGKSDLYHAVQATLIPYYPVALSIAPAVKAGN